MLSAAADRSQSTPTLLAYSDGSVTANGALGSAAAILRIGTSAFFAIVRLASADTALSSGRSEWTGLLLVLQHDGVAATGAPRARARTEAELASPPPIARARGGPGPSPAQSCAVSHMSHTRTMGGPFVACVIL